MCSHVQWRVVNPPDNTCLGSSPSCVIVDLAIIFVVVASRRHRNPCFHDMGYLPGICPQSDEALQEKALQKMETCNLDFLEAAGSALH